LQRRAADALETEYSGIESNCDEDARVYMQRERRDRNDTRAAQVRLAELLKTQKMIEQRIAEEEGVIREKGKDLNTGNSVQKRQVRQL
jgi:hypothetical protein